MKFNTKKALLWGLVVMLIQMVLGNLLYMNPFVSNLYAQYEGHPAIKTFEFIGGLGNWILVTMIFSILLMTFWIVLYKYTYLSIPGNGWVKGLIFGLVVGLIKSVPEAFNQWMTINYPVPLIIAQLINTLLGLMIFGTLMGFFFHRFKVVEEV